jgi:putative membrane protein
MHLAAARCATSRAAPAPREVTMAPCKPKPAGRSPERFNFQAPIPLQGDNVSAAANIVVALIALVHVYILVLEMFLWDKPTGLRAFGQTQAAATATKVLAANQGLYNGFLAAGLFWGLSLGAAGTSVKVFFLSCVLVAGLYGAATAAKKILYIQAIPAAIGLALIFLS